MSRRARRPTRGPASPFWVAFVVLLAAIAGLGMHRVRLEFQILDIGSRKAEAARLNRTLRERSERLQAEIELNKRPGRISAIARRHHHMRYPHLSERIMVQMPEGGR